MGTRKQSKRGANLRRNLIDLTGQRFGRLLVLCQVKRRQGRHVMWHCQCNCDGRTKDVLGLNLKRGFIKSCGCIRRETAAKLGSIRIAEIKSTPEFEAKRKAHAVRATKSKKYREDSSKRLLKLWQKDSYREAVERGHALNNWGEKQREARKRLWQDPKYRSKQMRTRKRSKAYRHRQFRKRIPMERTRII